MNKKYIQINVKADEEMRELLRILCAKKTLNENRKITNTDVIREALEVLSKKYQDNSGENN